MDHGRTPRVGAPTRSTREGTITDDTRQGGWVPQVSRPSLWYRLWQPFWAIPVALTVSAVVLGLTLPEIDEVAWRWVPALFQGGPPGARSVLGTITSAMISVTGLVFSITMVVLQLASSQFTPRILGSFLDSRITQVTLGVFTGTFMYALTVLRSVRAPMDGQDGFVPQLATGAAYLFVLASVGCFLAFIHHITTSIQVSRIIDRTAHATRRTLDRMIPENQGDHANRGEPPRWSPDAAMVASDVSLEDADRYLTDIDYRRLVDLATEHDAVVTLEVQVGEYIPTGRRIGQVWRAAGGDGTDIGEDVAGLLSLGTERSMRQDVGFGLRQLVDIAERALSPGVNDPTTATQVVDALHGILRPMVQRAEPSAHVTDEEGLVRLVYRPQTVAGHLGLAVTEIAHWGGSSTQIPDRLRTMLDDLGDVTLPQHTGTIARMRRLVDQKEESS